MFKWFVILTMIIVLVVQAWIQLVDYRRSQGKLVDPKEKKTAAKSGISGFIALFGDAIGIGSFGTLSAILKTTRVVPDRELPGTMMVGTSAIAAIGAIVYIRSVDVSALTLVSLVIPSTIGAYIGAKFLTKVSESTVQILMAISLTIVSFLIVIGQLGLIPIGGTAIGLEGGALIFAMVVIFFLGIVMNFSVGLFAPCMVLLYSLGMAPTAAFPIMYCACAFIQPVSSIPIIKSGAYNRLVAMGIFIGGIPGVLLGSKFVTSIPTYWLKWLIAGIVLYTAWNLYVSYRKNKTTTDNTIERVS